MRKPNKHLTRLVVWTISGSLLSSSCTGYMQDYDQELTTQKLADIGCAAIKVEMSDDQLSYYNYLSEIAHKILTDREFAKEFVNNPETYLRSRSVDSEIVIADDDLMRLTTALSDDDIAEAINNNDIKQYLKLMHKKGFLDNTANDYANLLSLDEKRELLRSIGIDNITDQEIQTMAIAAVVFFFYIAVIAVSYAGAAYTAVAAVNLGVGLTVVAAAAAAVKTKVSGTQRIQISKNFDIWTLSATSNGTQIILDNEEITKVVNEAVEAYKEIFVEEAKLINSEKLKQTINLNLSKQPIIAENILIIEQNGNL